MDGQPRPLCRSPPVRMSISCQWTYYPAATAATSGASFTLGAHESGMHDAREHVPKLRDNFARDFLRLIVSTEQTTVVLVKEHYFGAEFQRGLPGRHWRLRIRVRAL